MNNSKQFLAVSPIINVVAAFTVLFAQGLYAPAFLAALVVWGVCSIFLSDDHRAWNRKEEVPVGWLPGDPNKRWENGYVGTAGMLIGILGASILFRYLTAEENVYTFIGRLIMFPFIMAFCAGFTGTCAIAAVWIGKWLTSRAHFKQLLKDLGA